MLSKFKELKSVIEEDKYIYYNGEYYDITEDGDEEIEYGLIPAVRRIISIHPHNSTPFLPLDKKTKNSVYKDGIMTDDDGFLPDSKTRLYKIVDDDIDDEFVLFRYADEVSDITGNICVRNSCEECEHKDVCGVEIIEINDIDRHFRIVSTDISGQEGVIASAITHKEPRWIEVFRNRSLRALGLDLYLNVIFQEQYGIDTNHINSFAYWTFLETVFDERFDFGTDNTLGRLINFNKKCEIMTNGGQEQDGIKEDIEFFINKYEEFLQTK